MGEKRRKLSLKTVYFLSFAGLVVVPLIVVLIAALAVLNQTFRRQAAENIRRAQEAVATELTADIEQLSMRLSHMLYTNNNELLDLASATDTIHAGRRYESLQRLNEAASYATEPVKDVVSLAFYMKDGLRTFYKNDITLDADRLRQEPWYQAALARPNNVVIGSYDTNRTEVYANGRSDSLILVAALAPDVSLDRSEKIEMAALFHLTGTSSKLRAYNTGYAAGRNSLGYMRLVDASGAIVYEPPGMPQDILTDAGYTRVESVFSEYGVDWKIESYVRTSALTGAYGTVAALLLAATAAILALYLLFSRFFLRSIVAPVQKMSAGLRQVEEGRLDVHLTPEGEYEVRTMLHSFNAMVRRLRALIADYEEQVRSGQKTPADYLAALSSGELSPEEAREKAPEFFGARCLLFSLRWKWSAGEQGTEAERARKAAQLAASFDTIPLFASRCVLDIVSPGRFLVFYRAGAESAAEAGAQSVPVTMIREMQKNAAAQFGVTLSACVGRWREDGAALPSQAEELARFQDLEWLQGEGALIDLNENTALYDEIERLSGSYRKLAAGLYIADEKTIAQEREALFTKMQEETPEQAQRRVLAVVLATARQFVRADADFYGIFPEKIDYFAKIRRLEEIRSLRLWTLNYFSWIGESSASRLEVVQTDAVVRAKRYVAEHYQDAALNLKDVAAYVDLNEKYFTTKFTKETGETFLTYLTGLRIQKAKELIRTTTFKMYEIAEMVGYNNPEHFNRIFKKSVGVSPAQYRKQS